jgi:predicted nucleic acid-binding protein
LTHAVIGEVIFHVQQDKHAKAASKATISFLSYIENGIFQVHELSGDYVSRMKIHRAKYLDKKLDFADLSLVLAAEDRQLDKIVTIDQRDFGYLKYGRKTKQKTVQAGFTVILPEL